MKLLIDQHLSHKLVSKLATLFPESSHVKFEGMERADATFQSGDLREIIDLPCLQKMLIFMKLVY